MQYLITSLLVKREGVSAFMVGLYSRVRRTDGKLGAAILALSSISLAHLFQWDRNYIDVLFWEKSNKI